MKTILAIISAIFRPVLLLLNGLVTAVRALLAGVLLWAALIGAVYSYFQRAPWPVYLGCGGVAILALVIWPRRKSKCEVVVEGVESPRKRRRLVMRKAPKATPELFYELCTSQVELQTDTERLELKKMIERHMRSRNFNDYELDTYANYWEPASDKQKGFLQQLNYRGKTPKYLGEASNMITACLIVRDYLKDRNAKPSAENTAADYSAIWKSATQTGKITGRDAAVLLQQVLSQRETPERQPLVSALAALVALGDNSADVSPALSALSQAWLASLTH